MREGKKELDDDAVVSVLKELKEILDKHDIPFYLNWGTLLGAVREGEFIEKDTDIDLLAPDTTKEKIREIAKDIHSKGFNVHFTPRAVLMEKEDFPVGSGIGFYHLDEENNVAMHDEPFWVYHSRLAKLVQYILIDGLSCSPRDDFLKDTPTIKSKFLRVTNIFLSSLPYKLKQLLYHLSYPVLRLSGAFYARLIIPADLVATSKSINFYGMDFRIPKKIDEYLTYIYDDWRTPVKDDDYPHITTRENYHYWKGTFPKIIVTCPKCDTSKIVDNPHKKGDGKAPILPISITCNNCGHKWQEDIYIKGTILKKIGL